MVPCDVRQVLTDVLCVLSKDDNESSLSVEERLPSPGVATSRWSDERVNGEERSVVDIVEVRRGGNGRRMEDTGDESKMSDRRRSVQLDCWHWRDGFSS